MGFDILNHFLEGVKKKFFHQNYKTFFNFFEIEVEISQDFFTKLGSNDSANDSAYSNASKYTFLPSNPKISGVDTRLRKIFVKDVAIKKK